MFARLVIAVSPSLRDSRPDSLEPQPEHPARVALVDLRLVLVGGPHARHGLDGLADEPGALLRIERHVGAEEHVICAEEGQAGLHRVPGAEQRRVAVEHPKIVDRTEAQPRQRPRVLGGLAGCIQIGRSRWAMRAKIGWYSGMSSGRPATLV